MEDAKTYILKKVLPDTDEERKVWTIDSDSRADYAVQKIQGIREEYARLREGLREEIIDIQNLMQELNDKENDDADIAFYTYNLEVYFNQVEHDQTKTRETYKLLDGRKLVLQQHQPKYHRDTETILKYLHDHDIKDYTISEVVEKLDWKTLKLQVNRKDGKVIFRGEELPGVEIEDRPNEFKVE